MTPQQQELIRASWSSVAPIADDAARIFYDRLFELDPSIRPMFAHTDMDGQRKVLMQTLAVVVKSIDRLETLVPAVEALGRRHAGYGVQPGHYATVGRALLDTLEAGLGKAFTPVVRDAWTEAYTILASVMLAATDSVEAPAAA
jgi:hemoglobin-like flavoprotein